MCVRQRPGTTIRTEGHQGASPQAIAERLRARKEVPDSAFDRWLPPHLRAVSEKHWTPLRVAASAARWLERVGARSVVDVGSGAGKFCVAVALGSGLICRGVEQRPGLVAAARELARTFQVEDRVSFDEGGCPGLPEADAYYFFNPFAENLFGPDEHIDESVELRPDRYAVEVRLATAFLKALPPGALVLTYHGFGANMPRTYDELRPEEQASALLRLFRKSTRRR